MICGTNQLNPIFKICGKAEIELNFFQFRILYLMIFASVGSDFKNYFQTCPIALSLKY